MYNEYRALLSTLAPENKGRVFLYQGHPIKSWRTACRGARRRAEIEDFRWHDIRHTAGSWMVQNGVELDVVQKVLGHANIQTTMRYAHRKDTARRSAVEVLGAQFGHSAVEADSQMPEKKKDSAG
jgi:integrase